MEFEFNVNKLLPSKISKISSDTVAKVYKADRRESSECQKRLMRILDEMGEASARAQGLNKSITSARKLRDTDHIVYLLVDAQANDGLGSVVGLLKTGSKNLFMFDEVGRHHQLRPRCILDFYVHESRQRTGLGNMLYQHMLTEEQVRPVKLAIDRPSDKFLAFLRKYYGLSMIIPQNNKFVVFHGFFDEERRGNGASHADVQSVRDFQSDSCSNHNETGPSIRGETRIGSSRRQRAVDESTTTYNSYGRYAAARPPSSMAQIIHNTTVLGQHGVPVRTNVTSSEDGRGGSSRLERPRSLSLYSDEEQKQRSSDLSVAPTPAIPDGGRRPPFAPTAVNTDGARDVKGREGAAAGAEGEQAKDKTKMTNVVSTGACARHVGNSGGASVKSSSTLCGQQVSSGEQSSHLDLKFYHSPLW